MRASEFARAGVSQRLGISPTAPRKSNVERVRPAVARAAAIWSLAYGALGLYWTTGGRGFPFGAGRDPAASASILGRATAADTAPIITAIGFVGAIIALAVASVRLQGTMRIASLVVAWLHAVVLTLLIPDFRLLALIAYAPLLLIGPAFGWSPSAGFSQALIWPLVNQLVCLTGGVLWGAVAITMHLGESRPAEHGNARARRWTNPEVAVRWGKWAVGIAVVVPCLYAVTRLAWAFGIPLGIDERLLDAAAAESGGIIGAAFGLGTVALCGAILTLGLVQRWGEVFPRWIPFIGGTPVPLALVIVPAGLMSVLITGAGLTFVRLTLTGRYRLDTDWAMSGPMLLWPAWGVALATATVAYFHRTRPGIQASAHDM